MLRRTLSSPFQIFLNLDLSCMMQALHCHVWNLHCHMWDLWLWHESCDMLNLGPWPRIKPRPPALGVWNLNHWTSKEVPPCHPSSWSSQLPNNKTTLPLCTRPCKSDSQSWAGRTGVIRGPRKADWENGIWRMSQAFLIVMNFSLAFKRSSLLGRLCRHP